MKKNGNGIETCIHFGFSNVYAQTQSAVLFLDPIPSTALEGDEIIFSGIFTTIDGLPISNANIYIKDDRSFVADTIIGMVTTDENGEFGALWNAELRATTGSYDFYAVFEESSQIDYTRSQTYSVNVTPQTATTTESSIPITLKLILDPISSVVNSGDIIVFSGILMTTDEQTVISDAQIYIKDDRAGVADTILGTVITDENGEFYATWESVPRISGSYDFYVVFEHVDFGRTQSERYSVNVTPQIVESPPPLIVQSTKITLNPIQSSIKISKTITITGILTTSDGIPISNKEIQLSNYPYDSDILSNPVITNSKGEFSINWIPEKLSPYYLLTHFNGDENYRASKSSFSGQEVYVERLNSSISLDSFQSNITPGSEIIFSGNLKLESTNPSGKIVYIKDEDALDTDDVLASAVVDSNGFFSTSWIVEEVDSNDRKTGAALLELIDPSYVGAKQLNKFINALEKGTVEVYAVFEEDSTFKKSDTCTTSFNADGNRIYCKNNVLVISGESTEEKILGFLLEDKSENNDEKLFSMLSGDGISNEDISSLEEMLMGSTPIQQQNLDNQDMSLDEIFTLLEEPNYFDNFDQITSGNFDSLSNLEQELTETFTPSVEQFENIIEDSEITSSVMEQVEETAKISENIIEEISNEQGGGCLIATATYGSEMATEVQQLRELRDNQLLQTKSGTQFMGMFNDIYYSFSPTIADMERENPYFKEAVKIAITPMISTLSLMEDAETESEVLSIGISVIALNLAMYLGVPAVVIVGIRKRF
ncbi:MAG: hypothetical protein CXT78_15845 [Thaumarchaeota archaeon]|nr:MAG: hypothetical protein CXT78_15845 [Nitrososphaerota archaeon]